MSEKIQIGIVGLGLMGSSIATCILAAGHKVTALTRHIEKSDEVRKRVFNFLKQLQEEGVLKEDPNKIIQRLFITDEYSFSYLISFFNMPCQCSNLMPCC